MFPGLASAQDAPPGLQAIDFPETTPPEVTTEQEEPDEEPSEPPSIEVIPAPEPTPEPLPAPPVEPVQPTTLPDTGPGLLLSLIPAAGYAIRKKLK